MRSLSNIILFVCMLMLLAACSPSSAATAVADQEMDYSLNAKTGIEQVDRVLEALATADQQQIKSLIQYTSAACTKAEGLGGPPKCREGEAEGTVSEVLPFLGSEAHYLRKDDIDQWNGIEATGVYAIYRVGEPAVQEQYFPHGEYAIVLEKPDGSAVTLRIANGGIVRIDDLFQVTQESLENLVAQDSTEVILAPKVR